MSVGTARRHVYRPRGSARELLHAKNSEVVLSGPAGTGKSRACLEKIHFMALLNPGSRYLICRKARSSLNSTGLVTFRRHVANEALLSGDLEFYGGSVDEAGYHYRVNGSVIVIGGLDKSSKIMSSEYDAIYVQEATELTEDDWEALITRLRNGRVSFSQIIGDCNPSQPTHWLKQRCDSGRARMLATRHEENPLYFTADGHLTPLGADYISKLDGLTGVRYLRLRQGVWAAAEGVIYDKWSDAVHIVDDMPRGWDTWTRYWSVDFGFTNPFVWQCWAESPDGELYLYREHYQTKRTVEQHAQTMLSLVTREDGSWIEPQPVKIVCDHDADGRAVLEGYFGSTTAAHKSVSGGIEAVQNRLSASPAPRLLVLRTALTRRDPDLDSAKKPCSLLEEIPGYVWADGKQDTPVKQDDHGCDAMRYMVAEQDFGYSSHGFRVFF